MNSTDAENLTGILCLLGGEDWTQKTTKLNKTDAKRAFLTVFQVRKGRDQQRSRFVTDPGARIASPKGLQLCD